MHIIGFEQHIELSSNLLTLTHDTKVKNKNNYNLLSYVQTVSI